MESKFTSACQLQRSNGKSSSENFMFTLRIRLHYNAQILSLEKK